MPPLPPADHILKVQTAGTYGVTNWANVWYCQYAGTDPTPANLTTVADAIRSAWSVDLRALSVPTYKLETITLTDLHKDTGNSVAATVSEPGTSTGVGLSAQVSMCVSKIIGRRYRGGHPRWYVGGIGDANILDQQNFKDTYRLQAIAAFTAFRLKINVITSASTGTLTMVNVSYFERGPVKGTSVLRSTPKIDAVTGFKANSRIDTQRRRLN